MNTRIPKISLIGAVTDNGMYALNGKMPWEARGQKLKEDLKRFQQLTTGNIVVMGRETLRSMGNKPLKQRVNIVVSRSLRSAGSCLIEKSVLSALKLADVLAEGREIFVIGGAPVWSEALPYASKAYVTEVHKTFNEKPDDDAKYFPFFLDPEDKSPLRESDRKRVHELEAGVTVSFVTYQRNA